MDEAKERELLLRYYSRIETKKRNPTALCVKNESMRQWLLDVPRDEVACLDIETTGLYPHETDEVLQVSICDGNGTMLLNSYVRPVKRRRWPNAQAIHGITWQMVKDAPTLLELSPSIGEILGECTLLIGYNIRNFDLEFLKVGGVELPRVMTVYDLINDCSVLYSYWNKSYDNYTYISLENVAKKLNVEYSPHDSSEDVQATVEVFYKLLNSAKMKTAIQSQKTTEQVLKDADKTLAEIDKALTTIRSQKSTIAPTKQRKPMGCCGCLVALVSIFIMLTLLAAFIGSKS